MPGLPFAKTVDLMKNRRLAATIPAGTCEDQAADVPTLAVGNFFLTQEDVDEETVCRMTRLLFENLPDVVAAHTAASAITLDGALNAMPVSLHPGAGRHYREVGLIKQAQTGKPDGRAIGPPVFRPGEATMTQAATEAPNPHDSLEAGFPAGGEGRGRRSSRGCFWPIACAATTCPAR